MAAPPQRIRRKAAGLAAAFALLPALSGCGGVSMADSGNSTFTTMGFMQSDALASDRMDAARKALEPDGLHIQVNEGAFDSQQFLSAVAAGDAPTRSSWTAPSSAATRPAER